MWELCGFVCCRRGPTGNQSWNLHASMYGHGIEYLDARAADELSGLGALQYAANTRSARGRYAGRGQAGITRRTTPHRPSNQPTSKALRPNHFLGVRLASPALWAALRVVQHQLCSDPLQWLAPACVTPEDAHITLGVLHIPPSEVLAAAAALRSCTDAIQALVSEHPPPVFQFEDAGMFRQHVLWLRPGPDAVLAMLAQARSVVRHALSRWLCDENEGWEPHLTVRAICFLHADVRVRMLACCRRHHRCLS